LRINNKLEIRLNSLDLKQALMDFVVKKGKKEIADFMAPNKWNLDYLYREKVWVLTIDGIYQEGEDE
tara:strand:- start:288 stop:488 length:201 start_codon:yes stop_codon:yes gene_type:complete